MRLGLLAPYEGHVGVMVTGTHLMCLVDSLRAGLLPLGGRDGDAEHCSRPRSHRFARCAPHHSGHDTAIGGVAPSRGEATPPGPAPSTEKPAKSLHHWQCRTWCSALTEQ